MAQFDVLDMNGKKVSTIELSDAVFGITPNEKVMHMACLLYTSIGGMDLAVDGVRRNCARTGIYLVGRCRLGRVLYSCLLDTSRCA